MEGPRWIHSIVRKGSLLRSKAEMEVSRKEEKRHLCTLIINQALEWEGEAYSNNVTGYTRALNGGCGREKGAGLRQMIQISDSQEMDEWGGLPCVTSRYCKATHLSQVKYTAG